MNPATLFYRPSMKYCYAITHEHLKDYGGAIGFLDRFAYELHDHIIISEDFDLVEDRSSCGYRHVSWVDGVMTIQAQKSDIKHVINITKDELTAKQIAMALKR